MGPSTPMHVPGLRIKSTLMVVFLSSRWRGTITATIVMEVVSLTTWAMAIKMRLSMEVTTTRRDTMERPTIERAITEMATMVQLIMAIHLVGVILETPISLGSIQGSILKDMATMLMKNQVGDHTGVI